MPPPSAQYVPDRVMLPVMRVLVMVMMALPMTGREILMMVRHTHRVIQAGKMDIAPRDTVGYDDFEKNFEIAKL